MLDYWIMPIMIRIRNFIERSHPEKYSKGRNVRQIKLMWLNLKRGVQKKGLWNVDGRTTRWFCPVKKHSTWGAFTYDVDNFLNHKNVGQNSGIFADVRKAQISANISKTTLLIVNLLDEIIFRQYVNMGHRECYRTLPKAALWRGVNCKAVRRTPRKWVPSKVLVKLQY